MYRTCAQVILEKVVKLDGKILILKDQERLSKIRVQSDFGADFSVPRLGVIVMGIRSTWLWVIGLFVIAVIYMLLIYQPHKNESTTVTTSSKLYKVPSNPSLSLEEGFSQSVNRYFPTEMIDKVYIEKQTGVVKLKGSNTYFESKDKLSRTFSIDVANIFREVDKLNRVDMRIPFEGQLYTININREIIEGYFGDIRTASDNEWARRIKEFDNVFARELFFKRYVTVKQI